MSGVNKVILVGRLGKDPEVKNLESGVSMTNFSLATSEKFTDKNSGEKKENIEWHSITVWRGLADVAGKYLHKGDLVYVEGKLRYRSYEKDGITRYVVDVVADNFTMLGNKRDDGFNQAYQRQSPVSESSTNQKEENTSDDLPF